MSAGRRKKAPEGLSFIREIKLSAPEDCYFTLGQAGEVYVCHNGLVVSAFKAESCHVEGVMPGSKK